MWGSQHFGVNVLLLFSLGKISHFISVLQGKYVPTVLEEEVQKDIFASCQRTILPRTLVCGAQGLLGERADKFS